MQGTYVVFGGAVDISSFGQQQPGHGFVAIMCGDVKRREARLGSHVGVVFVLRKQGENVT